MQELREKLWREVRVAVWLVLPNLNVFVEEGSWCLFQIEVDRRGEVVSDE